MKKKININIVQKCFEMNALSGTIIKHGEPRGGSFALSNKAFMNSKSTKLSARTMILMI